MRNLFLILTSLLLLSACFKEEEPRYSTVNFETIVLGDDYDQQVFYSLYDTSIVSSNSFKEWNLAFYTGNDASFIRLNAAASMWVIKTESNDFDESFGTTYNQSDKRFDGSHGFTDNLAIDVIAPGSSTDTLFNQKMVYLIHPGIDALGNELGDYKKFMFEGVYYDSYIIRYANLDGSDEQRLIIPKDHTVSYLSLSWESNTLVIIEPDKTTWDLLFTRNTDTVYTTDGTEFLTGYAVTGAYLNAAGVEAYMEEEISYEDFQAGNIDPSRMSTNCNAIGHTWKQFSDQYFIFKNKSYIIKDREGRYFKLRFLSFYDSQTGQKGFPSFEFELLQ